MAPRDGGQVMRKPRLAIWLVAALLGGAALADDARACVSFNRTAEMRMIDRALASRGMSKLRKLKLKELRGAMVANQGQFAEHDRLTRQALALIGKHRVRVQPRDDGAGFPPGSLTRCG